MRHRSRLIAAILALAAPAAAHASTFEFYEGNNCTQDKLGGINLDDHLTSGQDEITILSGSVLRIVGIPIGSRQPWHDEARSVRVTTGWTHTREPRTARISIYDSPDAKRDDDWVVIRVSDATQIPPEGICIGSFEKNFDQAGVYLERHPKNGLDGKISYVGSTCDAACRDDLTPDPNAVTKQPLKIITPAPGLRGPAPVRVIPRVRHL